MNSNICPRCRMPVPELQDFGGEVVALLRKNLSTDCFFRKLCENCVKELQDCRSDPTKITNRKSPKDFQKMEVWSNRQDFLRQGVYHFNTKKYTEAIESYQNYVKALEETFEKPRDQFSKQMFLQSGHGEELSVFILVLWDLVVAFDKEDPTQMKPATDLIAQLAKDLPLTRTLVNQIRKDERRIKNRSAVKQLIKDLRGAGCFFATYAFADQDHEAVRCLRRVRDQVLWRNFVGRRIVRLYEGVSPKCVRLLQAGPWGEWLRPLLRFALIGVVQIAAKAFQLPPDGPSNTQS